MEHCRLRMPSLKLQVENFEMNQQTFAIYLCCWDEGASRSALLEGWKVFGKAGSFIVRTILIFAFRAQLGETVFFEARRSRIVKVHNGVSRSQEGRHTMKINLDKWKSFLSANRGRGDVEVISIEDTAVEEDYTEGW